MSEPEIDPAFADGRPLPVLASVPEARALERPWPAAVPAPLIAAAGGFLAGVVAYVAARVLGPGRRRTRQSARRRRELISSTRRRRALEISSTRSFLVDVHVLKR